MTQELEISIQVLKRKTCQCTLLCSVGSWSERFIKTQSLFYTHCNGFYSPTLGQSLLRFSVSELRR